MISNRDVYETAKREVDSWPEWKQAAMRTYGAAVMASVWGIPVEEAYKRLNRAPEEGE